MNLLTLQRILLLGIAAGALNGQIRVFDKQRDAIAQQALEQAKGIESGTIFGKQTRNLQALAAKDIAVMLRDAKTRAKGSINSFRTWEDLQTVVSDAVASTKVEEMDVTAGPNELAKLQVQRDQINAEIAGLQATVAGNDELGVLAADLDKVDGALALGQKFIDAKDAKGLAEVQADLGDLAKLLADYRMQMAAVDKVISNLNALKVNVQKALLQRLKVEEDFLLSRAALHDRREAELVPIRRLIRGCVVPKGVSAEARIAATLEQLRTDPTALQLAVKALYTCTSLAARGKIPDDLYRVRLAQLEHLKSIQLSAANARVYESILGGGVQRLALFYQGGVKPETLAQIVQSLSTVGIFGKFLTQ